MAYFSKVTGKSEPESIVKLGGGINQALNPFEISKNEAVEMNNMDNMNYPAISARQGLCSFGRNGGTYSSVPKASFNGCGLCNFYPSEVDGTVWISYTGTDALDYIIVSTSMNSVSNASSAFYKMLQFKTATQRYNICAGTSYLKYTLSFGALAETTQAPQTNLYTQSDNRLFALKAGTIYYSALGNPTDWTTIEDAGDITCNGLYTTSTAIVAYNNTIIAFSLNSMHILYGSSYLDFQLQDPVYIGCVSDRSIVEHNNVLYWISNQNSIVSYTGGFPIDISQKVKKYISSLAFVKSRICSISYGKYLLWSIPYYPDADSTSDLKNNKTLIYDTENRTWLVWDKGFDGFCKTSYTLSSSATGDVFAKNPIYLVDSDGYSWLIKENGTSLTQDEAAVEWSYITGVWYATPLRGKKVISDIYTLINLPTGSTAYTYYTTSSEGDSDWNLLHTFTASDSEQNVRIQIPSTTLQGIDSFRLKFSGIGTCDIFYLEPYIRDKRR